MKIYLIVILAIVLFTIHEARADNNQDGLRGGLIIGSEHWSDHELNEDQHGYYLCYLSVCAGRYENSFSNVQGNGTMHSRFLAYEHHLGTYGWIDFTAMAGFVDGYDGKLMSNNSIQPYAALTMRIGVAKLWQMGTATAYGVEISSETIKLIRGGR